MHYMMLMSMAATTSMKQAAIEAKTMSSNQTLAGRQQIDPPTCRVSLDGTWQKREFSSLNGCNCNEQ